MHALLNWAIALSDVRTLFCDNSLIALHSFSFTQKIKDHSSLLSIRSIYKSDVPSSGLAWLASSQRQGFWPTVDSGLMGAGTCCTGTWLAWPARSQRHGSWPSMITGWWAQVCDGPVREFLDWQGHKGMVLGWLMIRVDGCRFVLDRYVTCLTGMVLGRLMITGLWMQVRVGPVRDLPDRQVQPGPARGGEEAHAPWERWGAVTYSLIGRFACRLEIKRQSHENVIPVKNYKKCYFWFHGWWSFKNFTVRGYSQAENTGNCLIWGLKKIMCFVRPYLKGTVQRDGSGRK